MGVPATVLHGVGGEAGRKVGVAVGVIAEHVEVFKVFFLDRVLQLLVKQINETSRRCAWGSLPSFSGLSSAAGVQVHPAVRE